MNKRIGFGALVVLLVVAGVMYKTKMNHETEVRHRADPYSVILDQDRDILKGYNSRKDKDAASVYQAMIRLGEVKDPLAHEIALKAASDPSTYLREGSAQTLGFYDDDASTAAIEKLLDDKEPSVVRFTILGLGIVKTPKRQALLAKASGMKLNGPEAVEVIASRFRTTTEQADKDKALNELAKLASADDDTSTTAGLKMVEIDPNNPITTEMIKKKITEGKDARIMGIGIRVLASERNPWIEGHMTNLAENANPLVRKAVVQSLHRNCFKNRWQILDTVIKKESDPSVIDVALEEPLLFPETGAAGFYTLAAKNPKLNAKQLTETTDFAAQVEAHREQNPCAEKKADL